MNRLAAIVAMCLGACAVRAVPAVPDPALAPVRSLAGEWRVAGIDGHEIDGPVGIALRGDSREIWWEPRCAGYARSYAIRGSRISTGHYIGFKPPRPGDPPLLICLIAPPPQIGPVFEALTSATAIARTSNNGVEISGGGHSLLLFSQ